MKTQVSEELAEYLNRTIQKQKNEYLEAIEKLDPLNSDHARVRDVFAKAIQNCDAILLS